MEINHVYKIVAYEVDTDLTSEGATEIEIPAARYVTEAMTPQDAIMQVGDRLSAEESSLWASSPAAEGLSRSVASAPIAPFSKAPACPTGQRVCICGCSIEGRPSILPPPLTESRVFRCLPPPGVTTAHVKIATMGVEGHYL
jgi:hypothetical protein